MLGPDDIDECLDSSSCPNGSTCANSDGSYTCSCPVGYVYNLEDAACDDDNECDQSDTCPNDAVCQNAVGESCID